MMRGMRHVKTSDSKKSLFAAILLAMLAWESASVQPARADATQPAPAIAVLEPGPALDTIFAKWNRPNVPGCAVGVVREGSPPLIREYGSADLEHDIPIRADTIFEAGSVSKQFTAASILLLVQQGKLALTDDVRKYIPELPDYGSRITIDELLSHTSGLRDWGEVEALAGWPRTSRVYTLADVLAITARQRSLNYPPGSAYSYTNSGYNLLAIIVERISGQTLAQFSRDHLFGPLGMSHTEWRDDFRRVVKGRAIAYSPRESGYEQDMPFEDAYGNGGLLTTVGDLLRWNEALTKGEPGEFVTNGLETQATLDNGRQIAYARGLFVESRHGTREVAHSGSTAGYRAWLGRYPQAHLSIALLCNAADANSTALAHAVADLFLPAQTSPAAVTLTADEMPAAANRVRAGANINPAVVNPLPRVVERASEGVASPQLPDPQQLARLAGRYSSDEALATWLIKVTDGLLTATAEDRRGLTLILRPAGPDTFAIVHPGVQGKLQFNRDGKGELTGFTMSNERVYALTFHRSANPEYPNP